MPGFSVNGETGIDFGGVPLWLFDWTSVHPSHISKSQQMSVQVRKNQLSSKITLNCLANGLVEEQCVDMMSPRCRSPYLRSLWMISAAPKEGGEPIWLAAVACGVPGKSSGVGGEREAIVRRGLYAPWHSTKDAITHGLAISMWRSILLCL